MRVRPAHWSRTVASKLPSHEIDLSRNAGAGKHPDPFLVIPCVPSHFSDNVRDEIKSLLSMMKRQSLPSGEDVCRAAQRTKACRRCAGVDHHNELHCFSRGAELPRDLERDQSALAMTAQHISSPRANRT